jgi:hypothetical protein
MELMVLIARIILMILEGAAADEATSKIARECGINFEKLWSLLPKKYR